MCNYILATATLRSYWRIPLSSFAIEASSHELTYTMTCTQSAYSSLTLQTRKTCGQTWRTSRLIWADDKCRRHCQTQTPKFAGQFAAARSGLKYGKLIISTRSPSCPKESESRPTSAPPSPSHPKATPPRHHMVKKSAWSAAHPPAVKRTPASVLKRAADACQRWLVHARRLLGRFLLFGL